MTNTLWKNNRRRETEASCYEKAGFLVVFMLFLFVVTGCGRTFRPQPVDSVPFRQRAQTQEEGKIRVTVAVPDAAETQALFSANLYRKGIQPIWLEIENLGDNEITFLPVGTDPGYFTPLDSLSLSGLWKSRQIDSDVKGHFFNQGMTVFIAPRKTKSGFLFTRLDEGTKAFNVDVAEREQSVRQFTFFIPVPGLKIDHRKVDWENLYPPEQVRDYPKEELAELLAKAPCCTTDGGGKAQGDPLNLVIIGELDDVYYAFLRAGWDETETIHSTSLLKTAASFFSGSEYRYSPVSGLYVFGRKQDGAFQKARDNIHERNHLRLWIAPWRFEGKPVWLGQISRDIGVRFTWKTITTHKIDPDVDETREYLLEDLAYHQGLARFAYVKGVGAAPIDVPRANLTGDPYFTDGFRVVLWVSSAPVAMNDIEVWDWTPGD